MIQNSNKCNWRKELSGKLRLCKFFLNFSFHSRSILWCDESRANWKKKKKMNNKTLNNRNEWKCINLLVVAKFVLWTFCVIEYEAYVANRVDKLNQLNEIFLCIDLYMWCRCKHVRRFFVIIVIDILIHRHG